MFNIVLTSDIISSTSPNPPSAWPVQPAREQNSTQPPLWRFSDAIGAPHSLQGICSITLASQTGQRKSTVAPVGDLQVRPDGVVAEDRAEVDLAALVGLSAVGVQVDDLPLGQQRVAVGAAGLKQEHGFTHFPFSFSELVS